jgi:hypothetical protein
MIGSNLLDDAGFSNALASMDINLINPAGNILSVSCGGNTSTDYINPVGEFW